MEAEIKLKSYVAVVLKNMKSVISLTVICAIVFGGFGYFSETQGIKTKKSQDDIQDLQKIYEKLLIGTDKNNISFVNNSKYNIELGTTTQIDFLDILAQRNNFIDVIAAGLVSDALIEKYYATYAKEKTAVVDENINFYKKIVSEIEELKEINTALKDKTLPIELKLMNSVAALEKEKENIKISEIDLFNAISVARQGESSVLSISVNTTNEKLSLDIAKELETMLLAKVQEGGGRAVLLSDSSYGNKLNEITNKTETTLSSTIMDYINTTNNEILTLLNPLVIQEAGDAKTAGASSPVGTAIKYGILGLLFGLMAAIAFIVLKESTKLGDEQDILLCEVPFLGYVPKEIPAERKEND